MVFGNKSEQPGDGGAEGIRTPDPHNAIVVLYQLSYDPIRNGSQFKLPRACQNFSPLPSVNWIEAAWQIA